MIGLSRTAHAERFLVNFTAMPLRELIMPIASSRTLSWVGGWALLMGLYSLLPLWKEYSAFREWGDTPSDVHAALSLVLGWLLVFRTNTAYSRWWEARTLWGSLVNASRNLAIKLSSFANLRADEEELVERPLREFPSALMQHLRRAGVNDGRSPGEAAHRPLNIAQGLYRRVAEWRACDRIAGDELRAVDMELAKLMDICGACERIARTPMIRSYKIFARQCIGLFLITLPWGIAHDFGWWTIPLTVIIAYFMIGLETVAEHVEEPFGTDEDDLDLESLCAVIDQSVAEVFQSHYQKG